MSVFEDFGALLAGVATVGTDLAFERMPPTPDVVNVVAISPVEEPAVLAMAGSTGGTNHKHERLRVQFRARALTPAAARAKCVAAIGALDGRYATTVNGVRYHYIQAVQRTPIPLGPDETGTRFQYVANFLVHKALSST